MSVIMIVHVIEDTTQRGVYCREIGFSRHVPGNMYRQLQIVRGFHNDDDNDDGGGGGYDDDDVYDDNNNIKSKVISLIIVATGTISKSLRQYFSNVLGYHEIKKLQKKNKHTGQCTHTSVSTNVK